MIKYIRITTIILLLIPCIEIYAQQPATPLNKAISALKGQAVSFPAEKVYLHLDKSYYTAGDTIWFKGYTVTGPSHKLSGISQILNVELINGNKKIVKALKLFMPNGTTNGDIILPDSLNEGNYHVRAYTNWMRNYNTAYFYNKSIKIANPIANMVFAKTNYTYSSQNNTPSINAKVTYVNLNGDPFAGREVKYTLMQNNQPISTGSGLTDNSGNISINLANTSSSSAALKLVTTIQLSGSQSTKEFTLSPAVKMPDVQFFPESGSLINGISSKIAYKAVGLNGLGTDVKGTITDDQNNTVTTFNSTHLGMGTFVFTPQQGKTYKAKLDFTDGRSNIVELPKATDSGYMLNINKTGDVSVDVKITSVNVPGDVYLVAQAANEIFFAGKTTAGKSVFTVAIPQSTFPTGIVHFTLFSAAGEPLNERIVFIQKHDQLKLNISSDKKDYGIREKVKLELNSGVNTIGNFSAAVINESQLPVDEANETTILSSLLLTSDLAGYVEKPNYYFINDNERTRADLDVLMLTQGYHRFEWKQLISGDNKGSIYQPESGLTISGRVLGNDNKPVIGGKVSLFSMSGGATLDTLTNQEGRFVFDKINISNSTLVTIKATTAKNSNKVKIEIDKAPLQDMAKVADQYVVEAGIDDNVSLLKSSKNIYDEKIKFGLTEGAGGTLLEEVNVKSLKRKAVEFSRNLNGPGNANQVIYADNLLQGCVTFKNCLAGRLTGVEFSSETGNPVSTRSRTNFGVGGDGSAPIPDMAIIFNGVFVPQPDVQAFLQALPMNSVSTIEVLRSAQYTAIYGSRGGNGVIIITPKLGMDINLDMDSPKNIAKAPGFISFTPTGYYKARQFYSPKYNADVSSTSDLRSTIYWAPLLQTDNNGHVAFEYFNADTKGSYRVVIEGIDKTGRIGRQVYRYNVN